MLLIACINVARVFRLEKLVQAAGRGSSHLRTLEERPRHYPPQWRNDGHAWRTIVQAAMPALQLSLPVSLHTTMKKSDDLQNV